MFVCQAMQIKNLISLIYANEGFWFRSSITVPYVMPITAMIIIMTSVTTAIPIITFSSPLIYIFSISLDKEPEISLASLSLLILISSTVVLNMLFADRYNNIYASLISSFLNCWRNCTKKITPNKYQFWAYFFYWASI